MSARRRALGIPDRRSSPAWSTLEDRLLRHAAHARLPATALAPRLGRPVEQVRVRRRRLGLARPGTRRYTAAEDALLRVEWPVTRDVDALARRLGRSPDALRLRAGELGLHRPTRRRRWSASEDAIVRDGYADGLTCKEIAARLSQRTPTAIAARARKLRLATYARRWTAGDDARLGRVLARRSVDDAARRLGRTPEAVRQRARKLGIAAPAAGKITRARALDCGRRRAACAPCRPQSRSARCSARAFRSGDRRSTAPTRPPRRPPALAASSEHVQRRLDPGRARTRRPRTPTPRPSRAPFTRGPPRTTGWRPRGVRSATAEGASRIS